VTSPLHQDDVNRWFTHTVCVNLDRRPERWSRMQERFARHGISNVVRFSAVDGERVDVPPEWKGSAGAYGCLQSNLAVVKHARDEGWPSVLVLEDDVVFHESLTSRLPQLMAQVPADWDMLFLGGMHRDEPVRVRENLLRLTSTTSTYAYAVRSTVYQAFLDTHADSREPVDVRNRLLQERFNCYCFFPHLAWVDGGLSDTQSRQVDPWWLKESLVLGGPTMDRLQQSTLVVVVDQHGTDPAAALNNLIYTVNKYRRLLSGATVAVVEQPHRQSRGQCLNDAIGLLDAGKDKDFYVFADRDIVPSWDAKAHLLKCLEHDVASSFRRVIDLTAEDTARYVSIDSIDGSGYVSRPRRGRFAECCTITRAAFERSGGWNDEGLQLRDGGKLLSVFDSPALGLRLFADRTDAGGLT
jgi:glycosyl transferase, family 25